MIWPLEGKVPQIAETVFVAPNSSIIGDVEIGEKSSIWFNAVIRGDVMPIKIGRETNIQDNSTLHGTYKKAALTIGNRVSVGHNVILHGCDIGDGCLIGMGAIIMDLAKVPENCLVGAGTLITENSTFEPGHLILGRPGKLVRPLNSNELKWLDKSADNYQMYRSWYDDKPLEVPK